MEDDSNARMELNALDSLFDLSKTARTDCVCCNRVNKSQLLCGWESVNKINQSKGARLKVKKPTVNNKTWALKCKNQGTRTNKAENPNNRTSYFRNYESRKKHIEGYTNEFSTVRPKPIQDNCVVVKNVDPYLPTTGDHRILYDRLNILQTLSDFYNLGVSTRDQRDQHYLPPVPPTTAVKVQGSTPGCERRNKEYLERTTCKDTDANEGRSNAVRLNIDARVSEPKYWGNMPLSLGTHHGSVILEDGNPELTKYRYSSLNLQQTGLRMSPMLYAKRLGSNLNDIRQPSKNIMESLPSSLQEELRIMRSGPTRLDVNSDRFVAKPTPVKISQATAVRERTVNRLPHASKRQPLYISILGKNPLNREGWDTT